MQYAPNMKIMCDADARERVLSLIAQAVRTVAADGSAKPVERLLVRAGTALLYGGVGASRDQRKDIARKTLLQMASEPAA